MTNRFIIFLLLWIALGVTKTATNAQPTLEQTWQEYRNFKPSTTLSTPAPIGKLAFSPDGKFLAAGSGQDVLLWNTENGRLLHTLRGHIGPVTSVAFAPNGKFLVSGGTTTGAVLKLWSVPGGELLRTLLHETGVLGVAVSPDSKMIASAGANKFVRLWDVDAGRMVNMLRGNTYRVLSLRFSPDGKYLITAGGGLGTKAQQLSTAEETPDGIAEWLYETAGEATRWNIATGELDSRLLFSNGAPNVSISPSGLTLAIIGPGAVSNVRLVPDVVPDDTDEADNRNKEITAPATTAPTTPNPAAPTIQPLTTQPPTTQPPATQPQATQPQATQPQATQPQATQPQATVPVPARTSWLGPALGIWQLPPAGTAGGEGKFRPYFMDSQGSFLTQGQPSTAWSPNGQVLAIANGSQVQLWNGNDGAENMVSLTPPRVDNQPNIGSLATVVFSPDGRTIAAGSLTQGIQLWRLP